jgi:hypothetical protein
MTNFYAKNDSHCQLSLDGQAFYTSLCFAGIQYGHALYEAADLFQGMNTTAHIQMILDAGGHKISDDTAVCTQEQAIALAQKYNALRNPHAGMMQTSTGDWVMADDWDEIEAVA